MSWFKRENGEFEGPEDNGDEEKRVRTEGLWTKCPGCRQAIFNPDLAGQPATSAPSASTTSKSARASALDLLLDPGYQIVDGGLRSTDPLNFVDLKPYKQRLRRLSEETGLDDAILNAIGELGPHSVVVSAMEYCFIGGSMGAVVGETIARAVDRARIEPQTAHRRRRIRRRPHDGRHRQPHADGQNLTALAQLDDARVPYICILTDPTTGGVTASFAMLGDLNIAEPGALIGFAGPRVIEQTIRQKLPEGFQRSEFLLEKGFLDAVVHRRDLKDYLIRALDFLKAPALAS